MFVFILKSNPVVPLVHDFLFFYISAVKKLFTGIGHFRISFYFIFTLCSFYFNLLTFFRPKYIPFECLLFFHLNCVAYLHQYVLVPFCFPKSRFFFLFLMKFLSNILDRKQ